MTGLIQLERIKTAQSDNNEMLLRKAPLEGEHFDMQTLGNRRLHSSQDIETTDAKERVPQQLDDK